MTDHLNDPRIFDAVVLAKDAEAKTITFKMPDGRELVFPNANDFFAVGDVGCLVLNERYDAASFSLARYPDPRLRRWPEHDAQPSEDPDREGCRVRLWGWRLLSDNDDGENDRPLLVRAGVIPGKNGRMIEDETEQVKIDVPPEFFALCERNGLKVEQVLRGFIADVCGLQNYIVEPREDGYGSNGSDERMMASDYFQRAYGMYGDDS
jgi:hypothetical protein